MELLAAAATFQLCLHLHHQVGHVIRALSFLASSIIYAAVLVHPRRHAWFRIFHRSGSEKIHRSAVAVAGRVATDRVTDAFAKVVAFAPNGRSGYAAGAAASEDELDPIGLADRAAAKACAPGPEVVLAPGTYTTVWEPHATRELLWVLGESAFDGLAYTEGRGALSGALGRRVAAAGVNVADSPRHPATLPRAFDAEGVTKGALPLIQDGVAAGVVHHRRSAALAGVRSTGHALSPGDADGPRTTNLVMAGGGARDEAELCAGVERGIYVTRLWYTNVLRERDATFTAVTRDGTFLIEDGRITRPVADMRITEGALDVLGRVQALGARTVLAGDGEFYGPRFAQGIVCPALRAHHVRFTGSARDGAQGAAD